MEVEGMRSWLRRSLVCLLLLVMALPSRMAAADGASEAFADWMIVSVTADAQGFSGRVTIDGYGRYSGHDPILIGLIEEGFWPNGSVSEPHLITVPPQDGVRVTTADESGGYEVVLVPGRSGHAWELRSGRYLTGLDPHERFAFVYFLAGATESFLSVDLETWEGAAGVDVEFGTGSELLRVAETSHNGDAVDAAYLAAGFVNAREGHRARDDRPLPRL